MAVPLPEQSTPRVLSVDHVTLRRGRRYTTILIDAVTHRRVDVPHDRKAATFTAWLRAHPGAEIVYWDGSAAYAEAIRHGAPDEVQVSDRWHLWHGLGRAVEKIVIAHGTGRRSLPPGRVSSVIDERTTFVRSLRRDLDADVAGPSMPHSNGPIEGGQRQDQTDEAADAWTRRPRPAPEASLAQLTDHTTSSARADHSAT